MPSATVTGLRVSTNLLGIGFVEAIPDRLIREIAEQQSVRSGGRIQGQIVGVSDGAARRQSVGRLGWKSQHASLRAACADALANELGVPNEIYPLDRSSAPTVPGVIAGSRKVLAGMVEFLRSTQPVPRDGGLSKTAEAQRGEKLFEDIGCALCHKETFITVAAGTRIGAGAYRVPERLGGKTIHPYSDFLLHDVGTGDGIVQAARPSDADQTTANKFRTAPLWGLRYRSWLMHDGKSVTYHQAIERHAGEAADSVERYQRLPPRSKHDLRQFLNSL